MFLYVMYTIHVIVLVGVSVDLRHEEGPSNTVDVRVSGKLESIYKLFSTHRSVSALLVLETLDGGVDSCGSPWGHRHWWQPYSGTLYCPFPFFLLFCVAVECTIQGYKYGSPIK